MISRGPHFDLGRPIVEVNLCQHNGNKLPPVKSAIRKQDLKSIVFPHAWCMRGNSVQMFLMAPHGEGMCALIDFMLASLYVYVFSIGVGNCGVFHRGWRFDYKIDLFWTFNKYTKSHLNALWWKNKW